MLLDVNGAKLHCRLEGPEAAPCVALSNGLGTDMQMWDEFAAALAERYRVLRYDTRGHGGSSAPEGAYSLEQLGDDVVGLLDALGIARTHFVGLSLGGMTGMGLGLNRADRLLSLSVCDARAVAPPEYRANQTQRIATVMEKGIEPIVEPTVSRWFTPAFGQRDPQALDAVRAMIRRTSAIGYAGCAAALRDLDYLDRLPTLRLPVQYVCGAEDQGAPPEIMRQMQAVTPGARYVEIPAAGHVANLEQPALFRDAILGFLDSQA